MPDTSQQDLTRQVVDRFKTRATDYAKGVAQRLGSPASGVKLDNEQIVKLWNFSPHDDPAGAFEQMTTQGMSPGQALDVVHPYRRKLFQAPTLSEQIKKAEQIRSMSEGNGANA